MRPHPKLIAMQWRIAGIRRTVATLAVTAFVALFSTIYVQMATENDPVLAATTVTESTVPTRRRRRPTRRRRRPTRPTRPPARRPRSRP